VLPLGHHFDNLDQLHVLREIFLGVAGIIAAIIAFGEIVPAADLAGQKAAAERTIRHEPDAQVLADRQYFFLDSALPQRIFRLQSGNRMGGMGLFQGCGPGFGQAEMADLALGNEVRHCADRFLDRDTGVDAVLVEQIDDIHAQPLERALAGPPHIGGRGVGADYLSVLEGKAELGRNYQPVAAAADRLAQQFFIDMRSIDLGGVEKGDAQFDRPVDRRQTLGPACLAIHALANSGHRHAAEA